MGKKGQGPFRGTAAQKHLEPDGPWPIPAVDYIWVKMETASGQLSSFSLYYSFPSALLSLSTIIFVLQSLSSN